MSETKRDRLEKLLNDADKDKSKKEEQERMMQEKSEFICQNKWCKSKFTIERYKYYKEDIKTCKKCRSFNDELSGGVGYEKNNYAGERHDGQYHQTELNFSEYKKGKFWNND